MKRQTALLRTLTRLTLRQVNVLNPMVLALNQDELAVLAGPVLGDENDVNFVGFAQGNQEPVNFQAIGLNNEEEGVKESRMGLDEIIGGIEA